MPCISYSKVTKPYELKATCNGNSENRGKFLLRGIGKALAIKQTTAPSDLVAATR